MQIQNFISNWEKNIRQKQPLLFHRFSKLIAAVWWIEHIELNNDDEFLWSCWRSLNYATLAKLSTTQWRLHFRVKKVLFLLVALSLRTTYHRGTRKGEFKIASGWIMALFKGNLKARHEEEKTNERKSAQSLYSAHPCWNVFLGGNAPDVGKKSAQWKFHSLKSSHIVSACVCNLYRIGTSIFVCGICLHLYDSCGICLWVETEF